MRVDRWAAYGELLEVAGLGDEHEGSEADRMYRAYQRGHGLAPGNWRGGELDSLKSELGRLFLSCPFEAFVALTPRATVWRDVVQAVRVMREVPGLERLHVPLEWLQPCRELMSLTPAGLHWLEAMGPIWRPEDADESDDEEA